MKKLSLYALLMVLLSMPLLADTIALSFLQNATDNVFQNTYGGADQLSNLNFYINKNLGQFSLYTEGNYSYLHENSHLAYYTQDLGLDYLYPVNEKSALYFSTAGRGAFYRSEYSDFNYLSLNFFAAFKSYLSQTSILKSNYSIEYKNYSSSFFDFISHTVFLSLDKYLQSKTTLKAEMNWGYKYFLHPYISQEIITYEENQPFHRGKGKGKHYSGMQDQFIIRTDGEGQGIQILSLNGLIAQGLGNIAGLRFIVTKQWTLSGNNPFTYIEEFYSVENPSYDRFSWEGYQFGSQLSVLIPWNIKLKLGYTMADKRFPGIESLSLEGNSLGITREDTRKHIEASVTKDFSRLSVFLSYSYIDNTSNDPFFNWSANFFSLGIEWNIFYGGRK